ncbi:MAG TPA: tryptophan 2,3-dioxygenase family protein [Rhodanobacteraceae bacterium]|nr:tryptophan 2,3-dioxygenase family protein [Rhodanobacteraceae bacterium]
MPTNDNRRELEAGIERDLEGRMTYASYLQLGTLLAAQRPVSDPAYHDEMLFIVQHHVAELWLKLVIHELRATIVDLDADRADQAQKKLARVKRIQDQLFNEWAVLETMTPHEYLKFRDALGPSSGFQSAQYRTVEFLLGNKNADMLGVFAHDAAAHEQLRATLDAPGLYDAVLHWLARRGHAIPRDILRRDVREGWKQQESLLPIFRRIYEAPERYWAEYELCETLVDVEENFQMWRFRHMKAVERIIGHRRGTGGSSGVGFLKKALDLTFFPELLQVRTEIRPA